MRSRRTFLAAMGAAAVRGARRLGVRPIAGASARQPGPRTSGHRGAGSGRVREVLRAHLQDRAPSAAGAGRASLLRAARRSSRGSAGRLHCHRRRRRTTAVHRPLLHAGQDLDRAGMARSLEAAGFSGIRGAGGLGMSPIPTASNCSFFNRRRVSSRPPCRRRRPSTARASSRRSVWTMCSSTYRHLERSPSTPRLGVRRAGGRASQRRRPRLVPSRTQHAHRAAEGAGWRDAAYRTRRHQGRRVRCARTARLRQLGATVVPSPDEPYVLRFLNIDGIAVELRVVV